MKKLRFVLSLAAMLVVAAVSSVSAYASGAAAGQVLSPYTGDDSNLGLMIALICVSAAVIVGVVIYLKKSKKKQTGQNEEISPLDEEDK